MIVCLAATAILCYFRRITPLQGALAGFLAFISLSYQVNYQYLIVYIPLALLLASRTQFKFERIFALVIAILPAVWAWLYDVPWWFHRYRRISTGRTGFWPFRPAGPLPAGLDLCGLRQSADVHRVGLRGAGVYQMVQTS